MGILHQIVTAMQGLGEQQAAAAAAATKRAEPPGGGRLLDLRHRPIPQLRGEPTQSDYDDWAFAMKRTVRSVNGEAYDLVKIETYVDKKVDIDDLELTFPKADLDRHAAELYDLLCQAVVGEPLQVIKTVEDMDGFNAWLKLMRKYSPKSLARAVRLVGQVTAPTKISDITKAEAQLDKWEDLVKTMKKDFKEEFSDTVRVGIVTAMMPPSVQELIYQSIDGTIKYDEVIQKVRAVISNKVAMMSNKGPAPMDIGEVYNEYNKCDYQYYDDDYDHEHNEDVGAVSFNTQCHGCGGWGHLRRDCPTQQQQQQEQRQQYKGKGKGIYGKGYGKDSSKNYGKGYGKDFGKGYGKDYGDSGGKDWGKGFDKGHGKGFKGTCFACGKLGHRASECRAPKQANMVEEEQVEEEEVPLGGVWAVGSVEAEWQEPKKTVKKRCGIASRKGSTKMRNGNSFDVLSEASEDAKEIMAVDFAEPLTRMSAIEFHVADVSKPLASAVRMVKAGNRVVLDGDGSYILNKATGETMKVTTKNDTFVFDVQYESGEMGTITLDSGAGVNVWPMDKLPSVPMMAKKSDLRMIAANGSEIRNYGRKLIKFRGSDFGKHAAEKSVFSGRV